MILVFGESQKQLRAQKLRFEFHFSPNLDLLQAEIFSQFACLSLSSGRSNRRPLILASERGASLSGTPSGSQAEAKERERESKNFQATCRGEGEKAATTQHCLSHASEIIKFCSLLLSSLAHCLTGRQTLEKPAARLPERAARLHARASASCCRYSNRKGWKLISLSPSPLRRRAAGKWQTQASERAWKRPIN